MSLFDILSRQGTMEIHCVNDAATGLRAFIAIDDTRLGPAVGGARLFDYASDAINAGGLINVASEWKGYDPVGARAKTMRIRDTIADIAYRSRDTGRRPDEIADKMVAEILARAGSQQLVSTSSMRARPAASRARDTAV